MTNRERALTELRNRLALIQTDNDFSSDAGLSLYLGESPQLGADDLPAAIAVVVNADEPRFQGENILTIVPVEVQAHVKAVDLEEPWRAWLTLEAVIGDIKKAVETDHDLGKTLVDRGLERGSTKPLDREVGSEFVGAAVEYRLWVKEQWGAP